jgi:hypothetical protein
MNIEEGRVLKSVNISRWGLWKWWGRMCLSLVALVERGHVTKQDAAGYHGALTPRTIEAKDKEVYIDN